MNRSQDLILWSPWLEGFLFLFFNESIAGSDCSSAQFSRFLVLRNSRAWRTVILCIEDGRTVVRKNRVWGEGIFGWETSESEFGRVNSEPTFPVDDEQQSKFCIRFESIYTHIYFGVLRSFVFIFVIINSCETTYVDIESVYKGDTFFQEWYIVNLVENTCDAVLFFREYNNVDDGYSWIWNEIIRASFFAYVKRNILAFVFVLLFISTVVVERVFWLSFVVNLVVKRKLDIEKYVDRR